MDGTKCYRIVLILFIILCSLTGQTQIRSSKLIVNEKAVTSSILSEFSVIEIKDLAIEKSFNKDGRTLQFKINEKVRWTFELYSSNLLSNQTEIKVLGENGLINQNITGIHSFNGSIKGQPSSNVALVYSGAVFYLMVDDGKDIWVVQSAENLVSVARKGDYVLYNTKSLINNHKFNCGNVYYEELIKRVRQDTISKYDKNSKAKSCKKLALAIAIDYSMVQEEGSVDNAIAKVVAVMNLVATDYNDNFDYDIEIEISEFFVSNCRSCDPWIENNDAWFLLADFGIWGESGGFSRSYNLATLWSGRSYKNGFAGLAYRGSVCTDDKYIVLSKFTDDLQSLRVMTSHELGHAFNCGHNYALGDGCDENQERVPLIMDPAVNPSTRPKFVK